MRASLIASELKRSSADLGKRREYSPFIEFPWLCIVPDSDQADYETFEQNVLGKVDPNGRLTRVLGRR